VKPPSRATSKAISIIGAGVVLVTFIVQDVMREDLKDLNDRLGGAESFYFGQTSQIFIEGDLNYLVQQTDLMQAASDIKLTDTQRLEKQMTVRAESSRGLLQVAKEFADDLALVVGKVPSEEARMTEVKKLSADCDKGIAQVEEFRKEFGTAMAAYDAAPKDPGSLKRVTEVVAQTQVIHDQTGAIMNSVKVLARAVVVDLHDKMRSGEKDYSRATVAFYILFALGWVTSLLGQLLGREPGSDT
jgi:hypothetical protein